MWCSLKTLLLRMTILYTETRNVFVTLKCLAGMYVTKNLHLKSSEDVHIIFIRNFTKSLPFDTAVKYSFVYAVGLRAVHH